MNDTPKHYVENVDFPIVDIQMIHELSSHMRLKNRFHLTPELHNYVYQRVVRNMKSKGTYELSAGSLLYRARIHEYPFKDPFDNKPYPLSKMRAPPSEDARAGRINPEKIPYLYVANEDRTAIAEVRPWRGSRVTVARLKTVRTLRIADFVNHLSLSSREVIAMLFSTPTPPNQMDWYFPSQLLAEALKVEGFDGIMYSSAMDPEGHNVALFDVNSAKPISRRVVFVEAVDYKTHALPNKKR